MTDITVVTTFHKEGMEKYGQRFLDSFGERVSSKVQLLVYAEDCIPNVEASNITVLDANTALPKLQAFKKRWGNVPKANGVCPPEIKAKRPRDWMKEFKWDAVRFANKVYAVFDACEKSDDWVVWMDADTFVHSDWSYEEFDNLLPDDMWLTYVGRGRRGHTWPECGFYGLNTTHPVCQQFLREFERFYEDAEDGIFTLVEWHDSFVFGEILNDMLPVSNKVFDYTADIEVRTAITGGGGHPLINTELGKYIDHLKGARKDLGKSQRKDLNILRQEEYWTTK